ncbi:MAG TPA: hypothetical protein DDY14_15465, partial [Chromatiaceae bacterium]|nr:hypothetical protein [Chromatiaceae bacterium]
GLDIPAGTAVRFEPGQSRTVDLVPFAGERQVYGFNGKVMGALDAADQDAPKQATDRAASQTGDSAP